MPKRKNTSENNENIRKKIRRLEQKLQQNTKHYKRLIVYSDSENEGSDKDEYTQDISDIYCAPSPRAAARVLTPALTPLNNLPSTINLTDSASDTQGNTFPELDNDILEVLGDAPNLEIKLGKPIHKELASRWQYILEKGLDKDIKEKLIDMYLIPENCDLLVAPTLNPEVKAALAENLVKRDNAILAKQTQISVAVAALSQAAELIIAKESHTKILKAVSDACRLLCDSHQSDTKTRRGFVISAINPDMKDALSETKRDKLLFGENVSEKLKSAKTIKRSGIDLKQVTTYRQNKFNINTFVKSDHHNVNNRLNWKTMPRKITPKADFKKDRQQQRTGPHVSQRWDAAGQQRATAVRSSRRR